MAQYYANLPRPLINAPALLSNDDVDIQTSNKPQPQQRLHPSTIYRPLPIETASQVLRDTQIINAIDNNNNTLLNIYEKLQRAREEEEEEEEEEEMLLPNEKRNLPTHTLSHTPLPERYFHMPPTPNITQLSNSRAGPSSTPAINSSFSSTLSSTLSRERRLKDTTWAKFMRPLLEGEVRPTIQGRRGERPGGGPTKTASTAQEGAPTPEAAPKAAP